MAEQKIDSKSMALVKAFAAKVVAFALAVAEEQRVSAIYTSLLGVQNMLDSYKGTSLLLGDKEVKAEDVSTGIYFCEVELSKVDTEARISLQNERLGLETLLNAPGFLTEEEATAAKEAIAAFEEASTTVVEASGKAKGRK